jgi:hypothetical protein
MAKDKRRIKMTGGWGEAIADAERQISTAKLRINQLNESIEIFRRKLASGEPWSSKSTT